MEDKLDKAYFMINEIIDFAIEHDEVGFISSLEEKYGMVIDEAIRNI